jgi:hypothetical protein
MLVTRRNKIIRLPSGALLGEAGDADTRHVQALFAHVKTPRSLPTRKQLSEMQVDYAAILVLPNGRVYHVEIDHDDKKGWTASLFEIVEGYHAVGSGEQHAITAMDCLKSAKDAVVLATRRNMSCRPPVHAVPLKKPPRALKAKPKGKRK